MKNIAIALSGGGFRAAAFALGTLSYLQRIKLNNQPLLERVKFMGSTSGGSITNITYNLGISENKEFVDIYHELLDFMDGEKLIQRAFKILKDSTVWESRREKNRNLINAFSIAYDEFLKHAEFNSLFETNTRKIAEQKEVCVNATEFTNGLSFRFHSQKEGRANGKIGNNYIYFKDTSVGGRLLLGDIMASSSCFTGGFEPFIFPDDFIHDNIDRQKLTNSLCFNDNPFTIENPLDDLLTDNDYRKADKCFGLMDGGVADNQAIDSIFKANGRRKKNNNTFDLIIITDVTSHFVDGYKLPLENPKWFNAFSFQQIVFLFKSFVIFFFIVVILILFKGLSNWISLVLVPLGVLTTFYFFITYRLWKAKRKADKIKNTWSLIFYSYINFFLVIRYSRIKQMIISRLKSVFLLANDLYLKQIRRLYYEKIYNDPKLGNITIANAIYDLSAAKQKDKNNTILEKEIHYEKIKEAEITEIPTPQKNLIEVAEKARCMPTTLWFDRFHKENDTLKSIVATGQFTICYNLLKYLLKKEKQEGLDSELVSLKAELMKDWHEFNINPYFLYDSLDKTT